MPFVSDETKRVEAPALPIPPVQYNKQYLDNLNNVLRLYFTRLSSVLRIIMSTSNYGIYGYGSAADAFGRLRVSNPVTLFDSTQLYDSQALFWDDQQVSGSGTSSTHSVNAARTRLAVGASTAGRRVRQTYQAFNYQAGKSQLIYMTGILGAGETGITQRIGYGDDDNGLFFECDDGVVYVNVRTKASGSVVNNRVAQSAWNLDKLNGNGVSGLTVDWDKTLIFTIDFEWLGVGSVRFGVIVDAKVYYVHQVDNSNELTTVYMSTPNLPLRYELENDGNGGAYNLDAICSTVISEGGTPARGIMRSAGTGGTQVSCTTENTLYAVIGIRLKSSYTRAVVKLINMQLQVQTSAHMGEWQLLLNPTVASTFTYSDQTNSAVQIATGATANTVTGGTLIEGGYAESSGVGRGSGSVGFSFDNKRYLGRAIDGTADTLVLAFTPRGGSSAVDVEGHITWLEL